MMLYDKLTHSNKIRLRKQAKMYPITIEPLLNELKTKNALIQLSLGTAIEVSNILFPNKILNINELYKIFRI